MATLDEERYLRNLLLFGEGSMFLLRHLVVQEEMKTGKTLETLLLQNKHLFSNILAEQRLILYPSPTTANVDINTWDFSILRLVMKKLFFQGLPHLVVSDIHALKGYRDSLQGHPNCMSMTESDYISNRHQIINILRRIATYIQQTVSIEDIITRTESESIDIRSVIRQIKETQSFSTSIQHFLEDKLQHINQKLTSLEKDMTTLKENVNANEKKRKGAHDEIKGSLQSLQISSDDSKLDMAALKGLEERIDRIVTKLQSGFVLKTKHDFTKDLDTIIHAECENDEKQKKATLLLLTFVQIIQGHNKFDDVDIKLIIAQRVEWYGELTLRLIDDLMEWFSDINECCEGTDDARLGSIHLPIFCSSVTGLLILLRYINGDRCKQRLLNISSTISKVFGASFSMTWDVEPTSLQSAMSSFLDDIGSDFNTKKFKKLILPVHATDIKQLTHVWKMFGGEIRSIHSEKVSRTLSRIFKERIILKTSVDICQLLEAVKQTVKEKNMIIDCSADAANKRSPDNVLRSSTWSDIERSTGVAFERSSDVGIECSPGAALVRLRDPVVEDTFFEGKIYTKSDVVGPFSTLSFDLKYLYKIDINIEIGRMVVIQDKKLLVVNRHEHKLFVFDSSFNMVNVIELPGFPVDMCHVGEDQVAVCLKFESVVIVSLTMNCVVRTLTDMHRCTSITSHDNLLYILFEHGYVNIYDTKKDPIRKLFTVKNISLKDDEHDTPKTIAVSTDGKMIYVSSSKELLTIDHEGHTLSKFPTNYPLRDICVIDEETIISSPFFSQELIQIDQYGPMIMRKIIPIPETIGRILSMSYNKAKSRLLISDESDLIHVFELYKKGLSDKISHIISMEYSELHL